MTLQLLSMVPLTLTLLLIPLSAFLAEPPSRQRGRILRPATAASNTEVSSLLFQAACQRTVPSSTLLPVLERLDEEKADRTPTPRNIVEGKYELIYSSAVAKLPLVGSILDGYLPNKEFITFDLDKGKLSLEVQTFPFLPSIDVEGENLTYSEATSTLEYIVKGKGKSSSWTILYADEKLLAAKSSVTGLNVIKRV